MDTLKVVAAQINLLVGDIEGNADKIIAASKKAYSEHQADLVIFPELAVTGYPPEDLLFRPALYRRVDEALEKIKLATKDTAILLGYPERTEEHIFNKAALIRNGSIDVTYSKQKLPNYGVFDEKRYFTPGTGNCIVKIKNTLVGIIVCEDVWQNPPLEEMAAEGMQLLAIINASPFTKDKSEKRETLLQGIAQRANTPLVYVNIVGGQDEVVFDGGSVVFDRDGTLCQRAAFFEEALMLTEFNSTEGKPASPQKHFPLALSSTQEKTYRALTLGVHDYIYKNHFPGALVGLSGGIDSALTLAIAVDAIGSDKVTAVMMPSRYSKPESMEDAKAQAEAMGVNYSIIDIEPIVNRFLESLAPEFSGYEPDVTEENLQARVRGMLLMALSNKKGDILLTTGNKTEMSVGYTTLYGDMAGGFAVLKDVNKMLVYQLAKYRNSVSQMIPHRVLSKAPSAELAENQNDQDTLPPYPMLDHILMRYIDDNQDVDTIVAAGFDREIVSKIVTMVNANEYKRRQAPVGIRISSTGFGKDRRYPITSGFARNI